VTARDPEPQVSSAAGGSPAGDMVRVTDGGALALGGQVEIVGAVAAGRDIRIEHLTVIADDGPPAGDQGARPGSSKARCPYPGFTAFTEQDADVFFGRDLDVDAVLDLLSTARLVAVVGSSGSGKSSLLAAGVLPALSRRPRPDGRSLRPVLFRPGVRPMAAWRDATMLAAAGSGEPLYVIDQLEEIFDPAVTGEQRQAFLAEIAASMHVIVAIRSDFYAQLDAEPSLARAVAAAQHRVLPLDPIAVEQAIVAPAEQVGLRVESALVRQVVQELASNPNSLPLLGYALRQTWRLRRNGWLTVAGYLETGGIRGALEQGARQVWSRLPADRRASAERLLLRLSHTGEGGIAVRRRRSIADLVTDIDSRATVIATVSVLATGRLLAVSEDSSGGAQVEIAHESLLSEWALLRDLLRDNEHTARVRDDLVRSVDEWIAHDRDAGYLASPTRLAPFEALVVEQELSLTGDERRFLTASRRRSRRQRRLRQSLPALAVLVATATMIAAVAIRGRSQAEHDRRRADSAQLQATARSLQTAHRDLSTLLALAAYRSLPDATALGTLIDTVAAHDGPTRFEHPSPHANTLAAVLSHSGEPLVGMSDGTLRSLGGGGPSYAGHTDAIGSVVQAGSGLIVSSDASGVVLVHDERQAAPLLRLGPLTGGPITALAADGSAKLVVVATGATIHRLAMAAFAPPLPSLRATDQVTSVVIAHDTDEIIATTRTGQLMRWEAHTGHELPALYTARTALAPADPPRLALGPAGRLAVVDGNRIAIWSALRTGETPTVSSMPDLGANSVVWDPARDQLLVGHESGAVVAWQAAPALTSLNGAFLGLAAGVEGRLAADLATDGHTLVGLDRTGTVVEWPVSAGSGPAVQALDDIGTNVLSLAWSPAGGLADGSADGAVRLLRPDGNPVRLGEVPAPVGGLAWQTPARLVVGAGDGSLVEFSGTGRRRELAPAAGSPVAAVAPGPGGELASVTRAGLVRVLDAEGNIRQSRPGPSGAHAVAVSRDGWLAVATGDFGSTQITVTRGDGSGALTLTGHRLQVDSLAFSPDGRTLASGSDDRTIRLWGVPGGRLVGRLTGHTDMVQALAFSADGLTLGSSGQDGSLRLWDVRSRTEIGAPLTATAGFMPALAPLAGDDRIAVAATDRVLSWPFSPAGWAAAACQLAGRDLTRPEWAQYASGFTPRRLCP
jgi:WD40 repeat protein